jgi:3-oxoacyl-(acyl-carrier-protein) synthase
MEGKMVKEMIIKVADNIISPLGFTAQDNYNAVKGGNSMIKKYFDKWSIPEPFCASLFDREVVDEECEKNNIVGNNYTFFEKISILSALKAINKSKINPKSERVLFVLSTTKGNVSLLGSKNFYKDRVLLGGTAKVISNFFGNPNDPIVVSNACISGVCAQITAMRYLYSGEYDYVIVVGADEQSPFIISGFQSFKALAYDNCKPFDKDRVGLNLGEAAATIIYTHKKESDLVSGDWVMCSGAIRNDANHISGPSRTGEGCYRSLNKVVESVDKKEIAFINAHGTATLYNDEMESIAIDRAGLTEVPVNGLKGYYGHTMGAAGVLESIISMYALDDNTILATKGFENIGVSGSVIVSNVNKETSKGIFIKLLSGFGGCNAALLFKKWR